MANYTVSSSVTEEFENDSPSAGTIVSPVFLTITPDTGYVVSASDFSADVSSLAEIDSVTFADSTTPGALGNTVVATVTIASSFSMPASDTVINIDIDGVAVLWDIVQADDSNEVDVYLSVLEIFENASAVVTAGTGMTVTPIANLRGRSGNSITGTITANEYTTIATITVTADSNNHFPSVPFIDYGYTDNIAIQASDRLFLQLSSVSSTGGSTVDFVDEYVFDLVYIASVSYGVQDDFVVGLVANALSDSELDEDITRVDFGADVVSRNGVERTINVYGKAGATFSLTLERALDSSSILTSPISSARIVGARSAYGEGVYSFNVTFPANRDGADAYELTITPIGTSSLGPNIPVSTPTYTISQYDAPTLTFRATDTSPHFDSPSDIVYTGEPLTLTRDIDYKRSIDRQFTLTYTLRSSSGNFNELRAPTFSDWTNTDPSTNGGTKFNITNISTSGHATVEYTITASVFIVEFGDADVISVLDLDNIVTV